jgi:hypothetical protein
VSAGRNERVRVTWATEATSTYRRRACDDRFSSWIVLALVFVCAALAIYDLCALLTGI